MAKTKNGRLINPTDAFRKEQRRKQVNRNKLERKLQREAHSKINNASSLKDELTSILHAEESGTLNKTLRLKKKVLQDAYDHALKKQKETEIRTRQSSEDTTVVELDIPVPAPPPLPPGPPPVAGQFPSQSYGLPPPPGPPPGYVLPPPPGPPPGLGFHRPFPMPMQNMHMIPVAPVPKDHYKPPPKPFGHSSKERKSTIAAVTTVKKRPLAQNDKSITSMVPASVRVKRERTNSAGSSVRKPNLAPSLDPGAPQNPPPGLAVKPIPDNSQTSMEQKMSAFLDEVQELGAFD
eukprot:g532.t1